jgi:hypothetical protein
MHTKCELFILPVGLQDGRPLSVDHYHGVYLLLERVKRGKHRVDVKKLKPDKDLSGEILPLQCSLCCSLLLLAGAGVGSASIGKESIVRLLSASTDLKNNSRHIYYASCSWPGSLSGGVTLSGYHLPPLQT